MRHPARYLAILAVLTPLSLAFPIGGQENRTEDSQQAPRTSWRRYDEGPLAASDFQAEVPDSRDTSRIGSGNIPLTAYTFTEIRYDTRSQVTRTRDRWTARLLTAEAYGVILRDRSWNLKPNDQRLLEHEQGHFDITHAAALTVQLRLDELLRSRRIPVGVGKTSAAAIAKLEESLRAELKPLFDGHVQAQTEYDRITRHGANRSAQEQQRQR